MNGVGGLYRQAKNGNSVLQNEFIAGFEMTTSIAFHGDYNFIKVRDFEK